jgi:RecJ-like exonuclease
VQGEVSVFRGELEIVPEIPADVSVLAATVALVNTPTPTVEPTTTTAAAASTPAATPTALIIVPATATPKSAVASGTATVVPGTAPAASGTATATKEPKPTAAAAASVVSINALTKDNVGQIVAVRAKIVEAASFSAGFKFLVDDGTGRMWMTLFESNYKFVPDRASLNLGADLAIEAEVAEYKGVLELQPQSGRNVVIVTPGTSANVPLTTVNQLKKAGQLVAIEGTIREVKTFSAGLYVYVDDGTGNVQVTLFTSVLAYVPNRDGLIVGANVRVVGKTDFFRKMQVVPVLGYDMTVK